MPARRKARSDRGKPGRLDDMRIKPKTRGQSKNGPRILGNVGLEKGYMHGQGG